MRTAALLILLGLVGAASPLRASGPFEAHTIVTGMDARSRPDGLRRLLGQVLAKRSGNPALRDDARLASTDPGGLLRAFAYLDRMSDIPKHDEQGSRDRPFDLVARFDPGAIDAMLRQWSEPPWTGPRPPLVVRVEITPRRGPGFALMADTDADERHRGALLAAADNYGIDVVLPAVLDQPDAPPDAPVLSGLVRWSEPDAGWNADWTLRWAGGERRWRVVGVSFDSAYANAVGGVALALSGR